MKKCVLNNRKPGSKQQFIIADFIIKKLLQKVLFELTANVNL